MLLREKEGVINVFYYVDENFKKKKREKKEFSRPSTINSSERGGKEGREGRWPSLKFASSEKRS